MPKTARRSCPQFTMHGSSLSTSFLASTTLFRSSLPLFFIASSVAMVHRSPWFLSLPSQCLSSPNCACYLTASPVWNCRIATAATVESLKLFGVFRSPPLVLRGGSILVLYSCL
ncbi:uncharacterized protein DS421_13g409980 [Arachis hypogaea]|nr:uncharacterized protein DS421_13g409980 [Arachis hypogaea]